MGLEQNIQKYNPSKVILIKNINSRTDEWKKENLQKTQDLLVDKIEIVDVDISVPQKNWVTLRDAFALHCSGRRILIDITTMTRETIWYSLYNCKLNKCHISYIYYKPEPEGYSPEWISRDPAKPRLLYKMSGIAKLGAPTLLLVTGGYDIQRLDNLIYNFEPNQTILFFQDGIDQRNKDNFKKCRDLFKAKYKIEMIYEYDAYDIDNCLDLILSKLEQKDSNSNKYIDHCNIILNSLGSKTSAITLFKLWLRHPEIALSYIPSKEYNREYSKGIGEPYFGTIEM